MPEAAEVVLIIWEVPLVDLVAVEADLAEAEQTDSAAEAAEDLAHHKLVARVAMVSLF